jgi:hypothetical protein
VSPRLPDDLRRRRSARDHAGPVSHNHKTRTRGARKASLFVVYPGSSSPRGFVCSRPDMRASINEAARIAPRTVPDQAPAAAMRCESNRSSKILLINHAED